MPGWYKVTNPAACHVEPAVNSVFSSRIIFLLLYNLPKIGQCWHNADAVVKLQQIRKLTNLFGQVIGKTRTDNTSTDNCNVRMSIQMFSQFISENKIISSNIWAIIFPLKRKKENLNFCPCRFVKIFLKYDVSTTELRRKTRFDKNRGPDQNLIHPITGLIQTFLVFTHRRNWPLKLKNTLIPKLAWM